MIQLSSTLTSLVPVKRRLLQPLRKDLGLKIVSLLAAIALYIYVGAEHNNNPQITTTMHAQVALRHIPTGTEADPAIAQLPVKITGPRILVENLREGDILAVANLEGQSRNDHTVIAALQYTIPGLKPDAMDQIHIEGQPTMRVHLYYQISRLMPVEAAMPAPTPGYVYEHPIISPPRVTLFGREDRIHSVDRILVNPTPLANGDVRSDFRLSPIDKNDNLVSGISLSPDTVHVHANLLAAPPARIVTVSPSLTALPMPPYQLEGEIVRPMQIKVIGPPGQIQQLYTIQTEEINLEQAQHDVDTSVKIVLPAGVTAFDPEGRPISTVKVSFRIGRNNALLAPEKHAAAPTIANPAPKK